MGQSVRRRRHGIIEYQANATDTLRLSRGMVLRALYLTYTGAPTCLAANNTQPKTLRGDEWAAVSRIRVIANGTDVLVDIDGNGLWWQNYFLYGTKPPVASAMGDGATANPAFESSLIIPFWMPRSVRPIDTALDTRILSDLVVEVTWGDHLSINADNTGWTTNPQIEVNALESFGLPRDTRFAQWRRWRIIQDVPATNQRFEIDLPTGNVYRGFIINTVDDGVDVDTILNRIAVRSGNVEFHALDADPWQKIAELEMSISRGFGGQTYDDLRIGDANSIAGWYYVDMVTDGYLTEAIDSAGFSEMKLELDVTQVGGTNTLNIYPQLIVPVRGGV